MRSLTLESLTINELIEALQRIKRTRNLTGDEIVVASCNYGDRLNTMQAIALGELETTTLEDTCYSGSGYRVTGQEPEEGDQVVVCLNYDYSAYGY